jgi:hypothetical protein
MNTLTFMEGLLRDGRHPVRMIRTKPGFSPAVVLSLPLGIGANTAIFSVLNAVLIQTHSGKTRRWQIGGQHAPTAGPLRTPSRRSLHRSPRAVAVAKGFARGTRFTRAAPWRAFEIVGRKTTPALPGPDRRRVLPMRNPYKGTCNRVTTTAATGPVVFG